MLADKVAFITGAASGIGLEIARTFAREGAKVVISDLNKEKAEEVSNALNKEGYTSLSIPCNVTDEQQYKQSIEQTVEAFGRIDILVNNAGLQYVSLIEEFPTEKFEYLIKVMLTAPFVGIKNVFPYMKKQGYGRIINMASINGVIGFAGKAAYNSAKHGVIGLTKVAALEGAEYGITVNALCPGYVNTPLVQNQLGDIARSRNISVERVMEEVLYPLIPQKRLLDVSEIAEYALFLASEKAKGVTGQAVILDGGYTVQ